MSTVEVQSLNFSYGGEQVLKGITFAVDKNKFLGIIGANGSGKSTLLKNISGYLQPQKGKVKISGYSLWKLDIKERARLIGYLPQGNQINFEFKCFDVVMMGRMPYIKRFQQETAEDRRVVRQAMQNTNTWHLKERSITRLSGGERQRVLIARALAQSPEVLLMDEPITHLDIRYQVEILKLLKNLSADGILVIAVLHDINLAALFCDQIMILKQGQVLANGTPKEVLTEENIKRAFGTDVAVLTAPFNDRPYIIPQL